MKRLALVAALLLSGGAYAEPPREISAPDTIDLASGEIRTYSFNEPVSKFDLATEGIAKITPQTDHTFTIQALSLGQVIMTAYTSDGHVIYSATISVAPAPSRLVKIYGRTDTKDDGKKSDMNDYIGYYCMEISCSRADPDARRR